MKRIFSFFVNNKKEGDKKKLTPFENLVIIVVLGVIIILAGSFFVKPGGSGTAGGTQNQAQGSGGGGAEDTAYEGEKAVADLEKRLSDLLSKVDGAGQVDVMIFADSSSEMVPAYNNQSDSQSDEGNGNTSTQRSESRELALSGGDNPVVLKTIIPQIQGVVVVAEGAGDFLVKKELNDAVCTLLGVPEHRVQILKRK